MPSTDPFLHNEFKYHLPWSPLARTTQASKDVVLLDLFHITVRVFFKILLLLSLQVIKFVYYFAYPTDKHLQSLHTASSIIKTSPAASQPGTAGPWSPKRICLLQRTPGKWATFDCKLNLAMAFWCLQALSGLFPCGQSHRRKAEGANWNSLTKMLFLRGQGQWRCSLIRKHACPFISSCRYAGLLVPKWGPWAGGTTQRNIQPQHSTQWPQIRLIFRRMGQFQESILFVTW